RDEYGEPLPALTVATGAYPLEFTRTGWNNPLQLPRSNLQRVAYSLDADGRLLRHIWLVLDRAEDTVPVTQVLLAEVADFRINLLTSTGQTTSSWPDFSQFGDPADRLPLSVEVIVETRQMGELRRVIPLVSDVRYALRDQESEQGIDGEGDSNSENGGTTP
ncbi:MAG: type II secretion system minor pseudopilin GspJ, partial [Pseudomonadales bacterium]